MNNLLMHVQHHVSMERANRLTRTICICSGLHILTRDQSSTLEWFSNTTLGNCHERQLAIVASPSVSLRTLPSYHGVFVFTPFTLEPTLQPVADTQPTRVER